MKHSKTIRAVASLLLVLPCLPVSRAGDWEGIEKLPGQTPVSVVVGGEHRNYFRVSTSAPLTLEVEGPSRLRIYSRIEIPKESKQIVSYHLRLKEGSTLVDWQDTETSVADDASLAGSALAISKSRRMDVDVAAGVRRLSLSLEGAPSALVRIQQAAPSGKDKTVSLTPVDASRSVSVRENQKTIQYYGVLPGKPVKFRVVGPTNLDLITRLDFDPTMNGEQVYRLGVSEKGTRLKEVEFKTTRSSTAVFKGQKKKLVPSKYDRLQVPLGSGSHEITVDILKPAKGVAEVHARIPQPTVGHQE